MMRHIALWMRVMSVGLGLFLPVDGEAAMGALTQLSGLAGCVSADGTNGSCVAGRGLAGAGWAAVSPDGKHVYVASFDSSAVATFVRTGGTGALTQLSGPAGCVADTGDGVTCADGRGLDGAVTIGVSPDGKHVYVASRGGTVAAFARDVTTGVLTQLSGPAGCIDETGVTGCTVGKVLGGPRAITISPDGKHVYVGAHDANAVAAFARDATTGALTQLGGLAGCVSDNGTGGMCVDGTGLLGARGVTVSRDGQHLYVASQASNAVAIFARNAVTGALTQLSGAAGCIADNGDGVTCARGTGLRNPIHVEGSADGRNVYVVSRDSNAVTIFARNAATGALTQLPGLAGCIAENGDGVTCAVGAGLREAVFLTLSLDGTNLYVASQLSNAVAIFARNTLTGALTQLSGVAGCVSEDGSDDGKALVCADGKALVGAIAVAVSPDGLNVYAPAYLSDALAIFFRQ
jgi:6-phosphogluconolactonase (cycloisomerase 2 family)